MVEEFKIRRATVEDIHTVFDLSNDALVRRNSIHPRPIQWEEHQRWFAEKVKSRSCEFYIVESKDDVFMAQVRIEQVEENIISISLVEACRGKGLASKILRAVMAKSTCRPIIAYVQQNNEASLRSFLSAGYEKVDMLEKEGQSYWRLKYA